MERNSHVRVLLGTGGCQQQAARSQQTAPSKHQSLLARGEEELGGILGTLPVPPAHQLSQGYPGIPAAALHLHHIAGSPPKTTQGQGAGKNTSSSLQALTCQTGSLRCCTLSKHLHLFHKLDPSLSAVGRNRRSSSG